MMYRDYKNMPDISPNWSGQLFEHYMMFAFAPMLPMAILTIGFDFTARVGNETILPSGHCILPPTDLYESLFLSYMYIALHKIGQLLVFIYTLHYFHKLYVSFGNKQQPTTVRKSTCQSINQPSDRPPVRAVAATVVFMRIVFLRASQLLLVIVMITMSTGSLGIRCQMMRYGMRRGSTCAV